MAETTKPFPLRPGRAGPVAPRLAGVYLSGEARGLLKPAMTPAEFLKVLADADRFEDAFAVVSFLLPARLRLWWAVLCVRGSTPLEVGVPAQANFRAVVRWVREPTEENRRAADAAGESGGPGQFAYRLTRAVVLARSDPKRSAELVVESLSRVALVPPAEHHRALCRRFLALAIDVDRGAVPLPPEEVSDG